MMVNWYGSLIIVVLPTPEPSAICVASSYSARRIRSNMIDYDNPRECQDNLGTMTCWHKRYNLGDNHGYVNPQDFYGTIDQAKIIRLPLYLYDHSCQHISWYSWVGRAQHADWDSGQVGFIWVTNEKAREWFSWKKLTPKRIERVLASLKGEVDEYEEYLNQPYEEESEE